MNTGAGIQRKKLKWNFSFIALLGIVLSHENSLKRKPCKLGISPGCSHEALRHLWTSEMKGKFVPFLCIELRVPTYLFCRRQIGKKINNLTVVITNPGLLDSCKCFWMDMSEPEQLPRFWPVFGRLSLALTAWALSKNHKNMTLPSKKGLFTVS